MTKEKKNEIIISINREGYSLHYTLGELFVEPRVIINSMRFYNIIDGLIKYMPKDIYKNGIKKIYFYEDDSTELSKKEKKIFKGLINILERFEIGEKNLENKIEKIKEILIKKKDKEKFLIMEGLRNKEESFNSLYKIAKE